MLDYHKYIPLQVLVIDDFPQFSSALRTMLHSYGVEHVDTVHNGEDAVRAMARTKYDLILCDYNLGEGKNGNEVLEEAKHLQLLKSAALYLMITAESSADMVRGALEYQPDDYLTKPFTKEVLKKRLDRLLERLEVFRHVYRSMDRGALQQAIDQSDELIETQPRYRGYAQKLKAELMMRQENYAGAREFFRAVLQARTAPWARLGLGKTYFFERDYTRALKEFQMLVDEDRGYVQAWDWLAKTQAELGDLEAAQSALQEAVGISPLNLLRQNQLGQVARENGDLERAERAYSRAVKLSKNSVHRTPDSYLKLSELLVTRLADTEGLANKRVEVKAQDTLDELRRLYRGDANVHLQSRLMDSSVHQAQGREREAQYALMKALDHAEQASEVIPAAVKEQLIEKLEQAGLQEQARVVVAAMQQEESTHNTRAVELYDQGKLREALEMLQMAQAEKPRSFAVNLNLAQVAMHLAVKEGVSEALLTLAGGALERVQGLTEQDRRFKHYQGLKHKHEQLLKKQGPSDAE